jgi:hypothetical protein
MWPEDKSVYKSTFIVCGSANQNIVIDDNYFVKRSSIWGKRLQSSNLYIYAGPQVSVSVGKTTQTGEFPLTLVARSPNFLAANTRRIIISSKTSTITSSLSIIRNNIAAFQSTIVTEA